MRGTGTLVAGVAAVLAVGGAVAPAGAKNEPSLRLSVKPKSATVNRSTTFRFRVTTKDGAPVAGARIRFAKKTARTGKAGRARIVTTLHRARTYRPRASKAGYRNARRRVKARAVTGPIGFDGTCAFSGQVTFDPPLTNSPQPITQHANGPGTCSGTLVDRGGRSHELEDAPFTYVATEKGDRVSCGSGSDAGSGVLVFPAFGRLHFDISENRAGGAALLTARGARGGSATVTGSISPDEDQAEILTKCAGSGLEEVSLDANLSTNGTFSG